MAKKVKKKLQRGQKEKRVPAPSQRSVAEQSIPNPENVDAVLAVAKEKRVCTHLEKGIDSAKVSSRMSSTERIRCEDCREGMVDRRASKGKGKQGKKKGGGSGDAKPENKAIWICLECGQLSCGGIGFPTTPQSHAVRHAKQARHPLAMKFENHNLRWCFSCNTLIPADNFGEQKDSLADITKMLKGWSSQGATGDAEEVWFGSGSVISNMRSENSAPLLDVRRGYVVRGLINLGNTCFFNSVMQNLLGMDRLSDHFLQLDETVGPLTGSLKKLFIETRTENGSRNVINPRSFFGCVCNKAPQFRGYQQHDSHELLRCLLDGLCTEELRSRKHTKESGASTTSGSTFVDDIFGGRLSSTVSCLECGHSSTVFEPFLDLSLPVPTKKPPPKRAQAVARAKKQKMPPKRSGRICPKVNKGASSESVSASSAGRPSSCKVESSVPLVGHVGDNLAGPASSVSLTPSTVADNLAGPASSVSLTPSTVADKIAKDETEPATDNMTWLDILDEDPLSNAHDASFTADDITGVLESGKTDVFQKGTSFQEDVQSDRKVHSLCEAEISVSSDNHDMGSEVNDMAVVHGSEENGVLPNGVLSQDKSEASNQVCSHSIESIAGDDSLVDSSKDELPLQIQSSEVILLPYKEEASTTGETFGGEGEVPLLAVGCEPDTLDFDGFGDLFYEPEIAIGPIMKPSSSNNDCRANGSVETKFSVENISDSDPDEVDDSNSPVSIESCLAFFIKPELLSKEHAWHCESCSKALREQRKRSRTKQQESTFVVQKDGANDINESSLSSAIDCPCEDTNLANGDIIKPIRSTSVLSLSDNEKIDDSLNYKDAETQKSEPLLSISKSEDADGEMSGALAELPQSSSHYRPCSQASVAGDSSDFCSFNELSEAGIDAGDGQQKKPEMIPKESESEGKSDNEEVNSESVKVKRDATKRIVIDSEAGIDAGEDQQKKPEMLPKESESEGSDNEEVNSECVKVKRDATKRIFIDRLPPILTIHLKRFSQDARGRLSKLNGHVNFQETIDLRPYMDPRCSVTDECKYRLLGVVEHLGTMRGGHYVANVRGARSSKKLEKEDGGDYVWYHASDGYVREVSLEEVLRSEAYILFYEKI